MDVASIQEIVTLITAQDKFPIIREKAVQIYKNSSTCECLDFALEFYNSEFFQVQELGVFLLGHISDKENTALQFLKDTVSNNPDWRVQEIFAMAFDNFCQSNGYKKSVPIIENWLSDNRANVRRAVTEGLRIWTSRPYFNEHPDIAIALISQLKADESEYVRKSVGNSLRDISKKFPHLIKAELDTWDVSNKQIMQVYKLAGKLVI